MISFARGDRESQRKELTAYVAKLSTRGPLTAMLAARVELPRQASTVIKAMETMGASMIGGVRAAQGELALRSGRHVEAIRSLEEAIKGRAASGEAYFFLAAESLAEAYGRNAMPIEAARVLELASAERACAYPAIGSSGMFWIRTQAQLARFYRQLGRKSEAQAIEAELLKLLAYADADYPLLVELKTRQLARVAERSQRAPQVATAKNVHQ